MYFGYMDYLKSFEDYVEKVIETEVKAKQELVCPECGKQMIKFKDYYRCQRCDCKVERR